MKIGTPDNDEGAVLMKANIHFYNGIGLTAIG